VDLIEPIRVELRDGPAGGVFESRRSGEAGTVNVADLPQDLHDFGMIEGFGLNTIDDAEVDGFLGGDREGQEEQQGELSHSGSIQREEAGRGPEQEREGERPQRGKEL
jgi:hypothetical protein